MRVLHVMESTIGGTRRHIVDLAREQRAAGLDVQLCVATLRDVDFQSDLQALEREGCGVIRLDMVRSICPGKDYKHWRALERLLLALRPDIVHTHSSKAGVLGRLASLSTDVGVRVHTPHTFAFLFSAMFSPLQRSMFRSIERYLSENSAAVVAVSPSEGYSFHASGVVPKDRVCVVENGIVPDPFLGAAPICRAELGVPENAPLTAVIGLLNVAKGQDFALRMLVEPGLEQLHLVIAGMGEQEGLYRALASELGVEGRVRFLGWTPRVPELLRSLDFLLLPSRWEGMPYIVLEAMAAGLPVVASPVDGAVDLIEDGITGFVCRTAEPQSLARGVREVLACGKAARQAMGQRGRCIALERYTARAMAEKLCRLYGSLS